MADESASLRTVTGDRLVPPRFLFRFALPCYHCEPGKGGVDLDETYRLTSLTGLDGTPTFADVRMGWSPLGLFFKVLVQGKRQTPWCRDGRIDESDGLHVWIDTRDTKNIHRASRFCHHFVFLPSGGGNRRDEPVAGQLLIHRARQNPKPADPSHFQLKSQVQTEGYVLEAFVSAKGMTGYDPEEHSHLGFNYCIVDRERGNQSLVAQDGFPVDEDPSLWATLDLTKTS